MMDYISEDSRQKLIFESDEKIWKDFIKFWI
jgi:hypothetical protein